MTKTYYLSASGIKVESYNGETIMQTTFYKWSDVYVSDIMHTSQSILLMINGTTKTPAINITAADNVDGFDNFNDIIDYVLYSVSSFDNNSNINNAPLSMFGVDNIFDIGNDKILYSIYAINSDSTNYIQLWDSDPSSEPSPLLLESYPIQPNGERFISFGDYGQLFDKLYIVSSTEMLTYSEGGNITLKLRYK